MERIQEHGSLSASPRRVRLYREQVQDIIDTLKDAELTVTISDGTFTFNDLDDLKQNRGTRITDLTITGRSSDEHSWEQLSISFTKGHDPHIYLSRNEERLAPCWYRLRDIVTKRYRWHQSALNPFVGWFLMICFAGTSVLSLMNKAPAWVHFLIVAGEGVVTVYFFAALYWHRSYPVILLDRQHEASSFWKRNSDKIILSILSAVVGAVIALLIRAFVGG